MKMRVEKTRSCSYQGGEFGPLYLYITNMVTSNNQNREMSKGRHPAEPGAEADREEHPGSAVRYKGKGRSLPAPHIPSNFPRRQF